MKSYIFLENIKIYAYHGVLDQERVVGNNYVINLKLTLDLSRAAVSDDLNDTVSYADVFAIIKREMQTSSQLLEHVAGRILDAIKQTYPTIEEVELKLSKLNPPVGGEVESASVLLVG